MTFQLPSFSTVRRDGIELTVGFTATVNAELRVGAVEETVTVQGSSPVVDIQNVNQIEVITRELIDTIPTGRGFANFATLVRGVNMSNSSLNISQDVGGGTGYNFAFAAIHGGRAMDQQVMVNGMSVTSLTGTGGTRTNWFGTPFSCATTSFARHTTPSISIRCAGFPLPVTIPEPKS